MKNTTENDYNLSVIIPIAVGDKAWIELIPDLNLLSQSDEIIFSVAGELTSEFLDIFEKLNLHSRVKLVNNLKRAGRAKQLNDGAAVAENSYLWFVHSDSRLSENSVECLKRSIRNYPKSLHFFNLKFLKDGPSFIFINTFGAWFRSRVLRLPFGDQGFCVEKTFFYYLGRFNENARYGEDHLFVWSAHQRKIDLKYVGAWIETSARKYKNIGWWKVTKTHIFLTYKQAIPELSHLIKNRIFNDN